MKTKHLVSAFLFSICLVAINQVSQAQKQSREILKEFKVSKDDVLEIGNKFGDIDILKWDNPEISIAVKLTSDAPNEAAAKNMLDKISVEINKEGNIIHAQTEINDESEMKGPNKFAVNYTVYVPEWLNLTLQNKFGNIHIDEISGMVNIELKYGELRIMSLTRGDAQPSNQIDMAYSSGSIEKAGSMVLDLSFSKIEIENAENIVADTKYSGINASSCNTFKSDSKYDNFKFDKLRNLEGELKYSNLHIGEFSGKLDLESTFTGVKIDEVLPSFESIKIDNTRGGYKIGINPETNFDLNASSERGDISISDFTILEKKIEGTTKFIHAINGNNSQNKPINITVTEGSVNILKN